MSDVRVAIKRKIRKTMQKLDECLKEEEEEAKDVVRIQSGRRKMSEDRVELGSCAAGISFSAP
jgi:hypothetical protein